MGGHQRQPWTRAPRHVSPVLLTLPPPDLCSEIITGISKTTAPEAHTGGTDLLFKEVQLMVPLSSKKNKNYTHTS